MSEQTPDLVARAAARLRQGRLGRRAAPAPAPAEPATGAPVARPPAAANGAAAPAEPHEEAPHSRTKMITVDRGALAHFGASIAGAPRTRTHAPVVEKPYQVEALMAALRRALAGRGG